MQLDVTHSSDALMWGLVTSPDIAAGSTTFSVVVLGCTRINAHHIDFVRILMALGFPFSAVAHFPLLIPLLHTLFRYSGISVLLKCPLCSTDFPCSRRVFLLAASASAVGIAQAADNKLDSE